MSEFTEPIAREIRTAQRIPDDYLRIIHAALVETRASLCADRREYIESVLWLFASGVAQRAANPAALEKEPADEYSEWERTILAWAETAAKQLDELLDASL